MESVPCYIAWLLVTRFELVCVAVARVRGLPPGLRCWLHCSVATLLPLAFRILLFRLRRDYPRIPR